MTAGCWLRWLIVTYRRRRYWQSTARARLTSVPLGMSPLGTIQADIGCEVCVSTWPSLLRLPLAGSLPLNRWDGLREGFSNQLFAYMYLSCCISVQFAMMMLAGGNNVILRLWALVSRTVFVMLANAGIAWFTPLLSVFGGRDDTWRCYGKWEASGGTFFTAKTLVKKINVCFYFTINTVE